MPEFLTPLIAAFNPQVVILIVFFVVLALVLQKIIADNDNPLEWYHFISTRGSDGKHYADLDKLGKSVGIIVSSVVVILMTHYQKMDAVILGVYLAFVGGIAGYSAYLRSKQGLPPAPPDEPPKNP
jgi:nitric oxide reductase large subunit